MVGNSDAIVYALRGVRHSASQVQYRQGVLLAEFTSPRAVAVVTATTRMYGAVATFESAVRRLQIVAEELDCKPSDCMIASLADLVLYLRVFAILSEIERLTQDLHSPKVGICPVFTGPVASIGDASVFLWEHISRTWLKYGHLIQAPDGGARRSVVREVQHALTRIGHDPDLMYVLRHGMARPDWPGVFGACRNIAELLEVAIDVEPDARLFGAAPNPELIDDLPPSMRAGIRREDGRQ
jgi:hypothetical protein